MTVDTLLKLFSRCQDVRVCATVHPFKAVSQALSCHMSFTMKQQLYWTPTVNSVLFTVGAAI